METLKAQKDIDEIVAVKKQTTYPIETISQLSKKMNEKCLALANKVQRRLARPKKFGPRPKPIQKARKKRDPTQMSTKNDYKKNICGYITKKAIREFIGERFSTRVQRQCDNAQVDYQTVKQFYRSRIEQITGPSHIPSLLNPQNRQQLKIKKIFCAFFEDFIKQWYIRILLSQGKMVNRKQYIQYKNQKLFTLIHEYKKIIQEKEKEFQQEQLCLKEEEEYNMQKYHEMMAHCEMMRATHLLVKRQEIEKRQ